MFRILLDVKQTYLAEKIGVSQKSVSAVEKELFKLPQEKLNQISTLYNCNADWLARGTMPVFSSKIVLIDLSPLGVMRRSDIEIDKVLRTLFISFLKENNVTEFGLASLFKNHNLYLFKIQNTVMAIKIIGNLNYSMSYAILESGITRKKEIQLSDYEFHEIERKNMNMVKDIIKKIEQTSHVKVKLEAEPGEGERFMYYADEKDVNVIIDRIQEDFRRIERLKRSNKISIEDYNKFKDILANAIRRFM